jgi:hypothetical protein
MKKEWPQWELGEPDQIVQLPGFNIPPTGSIPYVHVVVDNPLDKPVWLRAVDFLPEDRKVVHHIIAAFANKPLVEILREAGFGDVFSQYSPGAGVYAYADEIGVRLEPGAKFFMQLHYTTIGQATRDATQMGFYFHDEKPRYEHQTIVLEKRELRIPAHARNHSASASVTFDRDIVLHSLLPHAHYRGRALEFKAIYPDGHEEILLSVPNYDFNWQYLYILEEPKPLPAGTTIVHTTTWDNSAQNQANPNPDVEVNWGLQSQDEMLFGVINYRYAD